MDYSYLAPSSECHKIEHTPHYIIHGEREKAFRKIYETVQYTPFEIEKIKDLKAEIAKLNIEMPREWKESDYLKIGYSGRFKLKEVIKKLRDNIIWRNNPIYHHINSASEKFLKEGIVYVHGRDKQFRPIVILNAHKIDIKKYDKETILQALSFMLGIVRKQMFVPGKVENWMFLLETHELGVFGLPVKALGFVIDTMTVNFSGCLEKMFILNPSSGLNFLWSTISGWLDEETRQKINFITKKNFKLIQESIPADQLEQKYGGTRPNQTIFWPLYNIDLPDGYTKIKQQIEEESKQVLKQVDEDEPYDKVSQNLNDFIQQNYQMYKQQPQPQVELQIQQSEQQQQQQQQQQQLLSEQPESIQSAQFCKNPDTIVKQDSNRNDKEEQALVRESQKQEIQQNYNVLQHDLQQNQEQELQYQHQQQYEQQKQQEVPSQNNNDVAVIIEQNELDEKADTIQDQEVVIENQPESEPLRGQQQDQNEVINSRIEVIPELQKIDVVANSAGCCGTSKCSIF